MKRPDDHKPKFSPASRPRTDHEQAFLWVSSAGRRLSLAQIEDAHLTEILRYLMGWGEIPLPVQRDHIRWATTVETIGGEMKNRGLSLPTEPHPRAGTLTAAHGRRAKARIKRMDKVTYGS